MKNQIVLAKSAPLALVIIVSFMIAGCVRTVQSHDAKLDAFGMPVNIEPVILDLIASETSEHRGSDDLLTAGLGAAGLRSPLPPAFLTPETPSATELRRRAIWSNWRGIADLSAGGGYDEFYGSLKPVPGREFHALTGVPGAKQPHRVLLQLPDAFDLAKRCVVVSASSGSRGIYGAISLAGGWGLPRGCAVAYTDKGAGTGYVDTGSAQHFAFDGTFATNSATAPVEFSAAPFQGEGVAPIAIKHANSGDNPEADWGVHVRQAADFALMTLNAAYPNEKAFTYANTKIIAVGVSNGGGAVLRAAESTEHWLDGVVAVSPNIWAAEVSGARSLYDYATEAAIWLPCALNASAFDNVPLARIGGVKSPAGASRCGSLYKLGWLKASTPDAQYEQAYAHLKAQGWTDLAMSAGALSTNFDLWRAVAVTYAASYARTDAANMPCGYAFHALGTDGKMRAPTVAEVAAWRSDASGIAPGAGVFITDSIAQSPAADAADPALAGLLCLCDLWQGKNEIASTVQSSIAATATKAPRVGLATIVIHGIDDGLIPAAFSSAPYVAMAKEQGRNVRYWRVHNAQHFDAFIGLPAWTTRYVPLMPYAYRALDSVWLNISQDAELPADAEIMTTPRTLGADGVSPLTSVNLGAMPQ